MAGWSNGLFSIGASGTIGGQQYNVVYTPTSGGGYTPTLIPSTVAGGGTMVVGAPVSQALILGALVVGVLLLVLVLKK